MIRRPLIQESARRSAEGIAGINDALISPRLPLATRTLSCPRAATSSYECLRASTPRGAERGQLKLRLHVEERLLRLEVHVVDRGVSLAGEEAGHPGVRVAEAPDGERDALGHGEGRAQHLREFVGLRERGQTIGG